MYIVYNILIIVAFLSLQDALNWSFRTLGNAWGTKRQTWTSTRLYGTSLRNMATSLVSIIFKWRFRFYILSLTRTSIRIVRTPFEFQPVI